MKRTKYIALGGILSALSVVILYISSLLPGYAIPAAAVSGLLTAAAVIHGGRKGISLGCAVFAVSAIISLLILPQKNAAIWYLFIFGHYGVTKSAIERISRVALEWAAKAAVYTAAFFILYVFLPKAFAALTDLIPFGLVPVYFVGIAVFALYDIGFSRLIGLYLRRVARSFGKEE